jgi:hypothetical protein
MAELSRFQGPTDFLRWVIDNKFSLEPLFLKHLGIIFGSRDDGACFAFMTIEGEENTCDCYRECYENWTRTVEHAIGEIPTFTSLYKEVVL